jgi:hypothetical protein
MLVIVPDEIQHGVTNMNNATYKAATFNGNVVTGKGSTLTEAKLDAERKAAALGSCIRKRLQVKE